MNTWYVNYILKNRTTDWLTSWCPPIYFVQECITKSAPRARAFWFKGVANVPSMTSKAPFLWQSSETSLMSTHLRNGLVGDSVKNRDTCTFVQNHQNSTVSIIREKCNQLIFPTLTLFCSKADCKAPTSAGSTTDVCSARWKLLLVYKL